jgi:aminodeoxyfutalosine deaminase
MRKLAAEWLFTGTELLSDTTLVRDDDGTVIALEEGIADDATPMSGLISPAFVNAHCHLELSHLKGKIPKHTGMAGFVMALQPIRDQFSDAEKITAMEAALQAMHENGIAAIGDICNGPTSLAVKQAHPEFQFHNFIELFGLDPSQAEAIFHRGLDLMKTFGRHTSITPHAPYSMSVALRDKLLDYAHRREWPISIHLLESTEERQLFEDLEGPMMDFIRNIGAVFQAHTYHSPTEFVLEKLPPNCKALLVHCTQMQPAEIARVAAGSPNAYFALCPLANQYIHNSWPDAIAFAAYPDRVCIGTDSLAGNDDLSILAEIAALQAQFDLPSALLLRWATRNGAVALGLDPGNFEVAVGNRPQLIHLPQFTGPNPTLPTSGTPKFINP